MQMQVKSVDTGAALLTVAGTVGMIAVVRKGVDFVKSLKNLKDVYAKNNVITQGLVWALSIGIVFLYGASDQLGNTVKIDSFNLADADTPTKIIVGLMVGSLASTWVDRTKAIDNTQSTAQPALTKAANVEASPYVDLSDTLEGH
jgi:hypothetical protein